MQRGARTRCEDEDRVGTNESRVCLLVKLSCFRSDKQRPARLVRGGTAIGGPKARRGVRGLGARTRTAWAPMEAGFACW